MMQQFDIVQLAKDINILIQMHENKKWENRKEKRESYRNIRRKVKLYNKTVGFTALYF